VTVSTCPHITKSSIDFFETRGFTFNAPCTDATAAAMPIGEDAYCMLMTEVRFKGFSQRPHGDRAKETNALFALGMQSRDEADAMPKAAVASGGSYAVDPRDHGFRYGWTFATATTIAGKCSGWI